MCFLHIGVFNNFTAGAGRQPPDKTRSHAFHRYLTQDSPALMIMGADPERHGFSQWGSKLIT
jgi:hypothetical protein